MATRLASAFLPEEVEKLEGEIVEIIERKTIDFVGTIEMGGHFAFVPSSRKMQVDILYLKGLNGADTKGNR